MELAGKTKKTKTDRYYEWLKTNHKDALLFAEQKEEFRKDIRELSSM
jgi:hypothetical protein